MGIKNTFIFLSKILPKTFGEYVLEHYFCTRNQDERPAAKETIFERITYQLK